MLCGRCGWSVFFFFEEVDDVPPAMLIDLISCAALMSHYVPGSFL